MAHKQKGSSTSPQTTPQTTPRPAVPRPRPGGEGQLACMGFTSTWEKGQGQPWSRRSQEPVLPQIQQQRANPRRPKSVSRAIKKKADNTSRF